MFDPTIFDNLKVVLEGAVYDLDLSSEIEVINRSDLVDLATMGRAYSIQFISRASSQEIVAEIQINTQLMDIAGELLEQNKKEIGVQLIIQYHLKLLDDRNITPVRDKLIHIWQSRPQIKHTITYDVDYSKMKLHTFALDFDRKIDESQISDISSIVNLTHKTLKVLEE